MRTMTVPGRTFPPQAILLACWEVTDPQLQALEVDCVRTLVASRPMVQRAVEQLVAAGCVNITILHSTQSFSCEQLLGKGERFGVELHHLTATADAHPLAQLARVIEQAGEHLCVASAMNIPDWSVFQAGSSPVHKCTGKVLCTHTGTTLHWTGWGVLTRAQALQLIPGASDEQDLALQVLAMPGLEHAICSTVLTIRSAEAALASLIALLKKDHPGGVVVERAPVHGVWIGAGSVIDPSAILKPPVHIGPRVNVQAGATVGPGVVLEDGSIIERGAIIERSWVLAHTYVGQETTLRHCIAWANLLINIDHDVLLKVADPILLSGAAQSHASPRGPHLVERLTASWLWLLLLPLVYLTCKRLGIEATVHAVRDNGVAFPDQMTDDFVSHPTALRPSAQLVRENMPHALALHFINTFHPGLRDVYHARVRLIGVEPRTLAEVKNLAPYWRHLHLQADLGLINETLLLGVDASDPLLCYAGDALAANSRSLRHAVSLVLRYVNQALKSAVPTELSPR